MKLIEKDYLSYLQEMGLNEQQIKARVNKRFRMTILFFILSVMAASSVDKAYFYLFCLAVPFLIYKNDFWSLKKEFNVFNIEREIAFNSFRNLSIPYLKEQKDKVNLYNIFASLNTRVHPSLQNALFQLMNEMVAKPNSVEPFTDFAKKCSNSDESLNFMLSLYDFQNSSVEISVIEELSQNANAQLLKLVDEVKAIKNKKVNSIPLFVALGCGLVLIPYLFSILIFSINKSGLL
jgi:hypothetical protein